MSVLIFDTETTHLLDFKRDLMEPDQPRITQLAAIFCDDDGNELEVLNHYIKPDGWEIGEEAAAKTGITMELLEELGIPMLDALHNFNALKAKTTLRVAHSLAYDKKMLAREAALYGVLHDSEGLQSYCTMVQGGQFIKSMGGSGKWPKLPEIYDFCFGKQFVGGHGALEDARATKEVFFYIKNHGGLNVAS